MTKKKLAILGTGNLARILAQELQKKTFSTYQLVAVCGRSMEKARACAVGTEAAAVTTLQELLALQPELVLEATTPAHLKTVAPTILGAGCSMIILSSGALADAEFRAEVTRAGERSGARLYVASGAIGGFDLLQTAALMGNVSLTVRNQKPPAAYENAPFLEGRTLDADREELLFSGTAAQAIARFPQNVNVAVAAAEASVGAEHTKVTVESDPALRLNTHRLELRGNFGEATLNIASAASAKAGSSAMAAYSVLRVLLNLTSVIVF